MKTSAPFLVLVGVMVFVLAPLTAPGYFIFGHDARHSVYFLQMFDMAMQDGAWFPRWATDMVFGYGYPLWHLLAPLPFYAGEAFHLAGFDFVSSVKIVDGLAMLFSALFMYLFASRVLGRSAGLGAAVAYVYVPYHLVDLYVRSAQAELVAFVFPPLVFWAFYELARTGNVRYVPVAAFAYAGLVLAHIQTAVLFTPIIGLYLIVLFVSALYNRHATRFAVSAAAALALGLGLAAVFMLPALFERQFLSDAPLIGGVFDYRKHFLNASQLLSPFWGYGYAGENGNDRFSLQLGLIPVLMSLIALWSWRTLSHRVRWHMAFWAIVAAAMVFLMLPFSAGLWQPFASIMAYAQFPWRLLIITAFALAFLSGAAVQAVTERERDLLPALVLVLLFVTANYAYATPQHTEAVFNYATQMEFEVKDRELLGDTIWLKGERPESSPLVDQYISGQPLQKAIALDGDASVQMLRHAGQSDSARVESAAPARILFYTHYFPGWTASLDGQWLSMEPYGEQGLILVNVPAGSHVVALRYEGTPVQRAGAALSGISLVIAVVWLAITRRRM